MFNILPVSVHFAFILECLLCFSFYQFIFIFFKCAYLKFHCSPFLAPFVFSLYLSLSLSHFFECRFTFGVLVLVSVLFYLSFSFICSLTFGVLFIIILVLFYRSFFLSFFLSNVMVSDLYVLVLSVCLSFFPSNVHLW